MTITFTPEEIQKILVLHLVNIGMLREAEVGEWIGSVYIDIEDGSIRAEVFHEGDRVVS